MQQFCIKCHGQDGEVEGEIDLTQLLANDLAGEAAALKKLVDALDTSHMPPEEEPQPSLELRKQMIEAFKRLLYKTAANSVDSMRTPMRRMNRFQYNNAVVDLFELKCIVFTLPERTMRVHRDYFRPSTGKMPATVTVGNRPLGKSQMIEPRLSGVAAFPQDLRAEHGYDNRADHLSMSPLLMESFLKLGQSITQSPDFEPKRVGIWSQFFASPQADADLSIEVHFRLRAFLTRAFRRSVSDDVVRRYAHFVHSAMESGSSFTDAMKAVASATLASPRFLYLFQTHSESGEVADSHLADEFELASRLSFFLWGSMPDETILGLAAEGRLGEQLEKQVDRMLTDRKLKRFCDSFPAQWLQLDRIISSLPNRERFPQFYFLKYRTSMHMMLEPLLLFETVLIENRPITQLIDPDFTYRSAKLEQAYGPLGSAPKKVGPGVTVLKFKRVPITDRRTGGIVTNAAVLTMTSGPERTKPITRGAWVAGVVFNDPPDPPPADVPPLAETPSADEQGKTLRERLSAHRERADCRGCHEQIDPLGFALENFDAVGVWRDVYENGRDIDASGKLYREHPFSNPMEFKDAILAEKDRFCRAFAEHLLSFALARELGPGDQMALERITANVAADDYKFKTLIKQIILSEPFRKKS